MKKIKAIGILLVCLQMAATAQTPVKFRKVIGNAGYDEGYSVQQTHDKGYIIGGATSSFGDGSTDMYAVKTDSMGIPILHKTVGGINIDRGYSIKETTDHGYILAGYTNSYGVGGYDMFLAKLDSTLTTVWTKTYGGADWDFAYSVKQTVEGGFILCGSTYSYGKGDQDYYVVKTTATGDTMWTKTYGGTGEDIAKSIIQTADSNFVLTGTTKSMGDSLGDIYTLKISGTNGDTIWTNRYNGDSSRADYGNDVIETLSGEIAVAGETNGSGNPGVYSNAVALRMSATGTVTYVELDGLTPGDDSFTSITQGSDGKIALAGISKSLGINGEMFLIIVDSNWNFFNATTFGSLEFDGAYSIDHTSDRSFVLCGVTNSYTNHLDDIYLVKTDTMGFCSTSEVVILSGIQEQAAAENNKFTVFPNPANGDVQISISNPKAADEYEVLITDVLGKEVRSFMTGPATPAVNTTDLASGMYYITLRNKEFSSTQKLIVHH
ncbi:MAG: hypothetical protein JWP12_1742 [Bacteroidetes bacterium]|nr:hypothetical protein [Bacteroidota bacterium]